MSEEFRVYRTFRYGSTVHCYIRPVLSSAELVNYLREAFLTDSTFTRHKHRQIRRCHLHSYINSPVKAFSVTYYAKP